MGSYKVSTKTSENTCRINKAQLFSFNYLFVGKLLVDMETGRDLRKVLEKKNLLDNDAGIKTMKEILHNIGKKELAAKLDELIVIG